jgi:outer membrane receptor protein involved in Fe transport
MRSLLLKEKQMNRSIRSMRALTFIAAALLLLSLGCCNANAQTFRGTILGTVTDSSGGSVAGATVTIKNVDTGLTRTVTTSEDGSYAVPELPLGNYSVSVEKQGFKTGVVSGLRVEVQSERRVDVTLQPGQLAQTVEVLGEELPMVESTSNTLGGIVESKVAANLPVNGRDYQKLVLLVPGAASAPDGITDSPGSYGTVSVNGARGRSNNYLLDGTDMNDGYRNDPAINEGGVFGTPATILPIEAVAEIHVASNFEAEYGRSAGAAINIVTKSGGNDWHGAGFEFLRNTDLNARNYFNRVSDGPQQPFHLNQFGGDIGGPIIKDKTFFFVDYEGLRETGAEASNACVPTAADISNHAPTPGDPSTVNPVIQNLLNATAVTWPTPTIAGSCIAAEGDLIAQTAVPFNAALATPFSNRVDNGIVKIDHNFTKNNLLTGRYYIGDSTQLFPLALTGGGLLPNYSTRVPTRVQMVAISFVSVISPNIVNEARLGWNRFAEGFFPQDQNFDPSTIHLNTVGSGTPNDSNPYNFGLPVFNVPTFAQLGADKADPRQRVDTNWHYIDNVSWKSGKHEIKFGYEFRRTSVSQIFNRTFRGRLRFDSFDDFLAGIPKSNSTQGIGDTNRNTMENSQAFYLQDSWRLTRRVTLNLGLRYDYFGIVQEKHGMFDNVDPTTGGVFPVGQGRLYQPDYNNWAPRVSVAWDVTGKGRTVVRAGFGIFYDAFSQDMFLGHIPYSSSFDPGPAYSGLPGVGQVSFGSPVNDGLGHDLPIAPDVPVFANYLPMGDAFGFDPHIRAPYLENFNLNLQQQLTRKMVVQLGYIGSRGHKLLDFRDINQPSAAQIFAADCPGGGTPGQECAGGVISSFVPRRITDSLTYIYWEESAANSNYNALQATFRIDNWHGLTSGLSYTWSHSIDTASDGEDYVPNAAQPTDSTFLKSNKGNSNFDVRNRLSWNFIYEFPNRKGSWERLTNGWGLNGIVTVQSGAPFHMILGLDDYDGAGTFFPKPDVVGPIRYNYSDPNNFLDLTSFAAPCTPALDAGNNPAFDGSAGTCQPGTRHFGNLGRNSLLGPHFRQLDFSIFKNTNITERVKLELRFEAYNLFNHPNFASPLWPNFLSDPTLTNGFGSDGRLVGTLPLAVTADVGVGYPVLGGGGQRSLQIGAKITF